MRRRAALRSAFSCCCFAVSTALCTKITSPFSVRAQGDNTPYEVVSNLFDSNTATKWLNLISEEETQKLQEMKLLGKLVGADEVPVDPWIEMRFDAKVTVNKYAMSSAIDHIERDPRSWTLRAWDDIASQWQLLDTRNNELFHARSMTREFWPQKNGSFSIYQFAFTELREGAQFAQPAAAGVQLADIDMYDGECSKGGAAVMTQSVSGYNHHVYRMSDGTAQTWGDGAYGKLGHNDTESVPAPKTIFNLNAIVQVAAGGSHTLFLMEDGTVQSVGSGAVGQLGHGDNKNLHIPRMIEQPIPAGSLPPVDFVGFGPVQAVAAGQDHSIALMSDGKVATWGLGIYGQLGFQLDGTGTYINVPTILPNAQGITKVEGGSIYSLLWSGAAQDKGEILLNLDEYPHFTMKNQYPQIGADTQYANRIVQESRFWSSPVNEHYGRVSSVSTAVRPPILHWNNVNDAVPSVYGGHDSVYSNYDSNLDHVGPPVVADAMAPGATYMDKDLTTRGQVLMQKLEDTSWANADDNPQAR